MKIKVVEFSKKSSKISKQCELLEDAAVIYRLGHDSISAMVNIDGSFIECDIADIGYFLAKNKAV